jgi:hypothetical protein
MTIRTVEYRETRTFGDYQNVTVGLTADVDQDDNEERVLDVLKDWVQVRLAQRIEHDRQAIQEEHAVREAGWELTEVRRKIDVEKIRLDRIREILKRNGVELSGDDDLPF